MMFVIRFVIVICANLGCNNDPWSGSGQPVEMNNKETKIGAWRVSNSSGGSNLTVPELV